MIKSYFSCILILIVAVLFETSILSNIFFLPAIPDFLLMCTLYFSIRNGKTSGEVNGFLSGLFLDALSGTPFGLNMLIRTLLGYAGGAFCNMLNIQSFLVSLMTGFVATIAKAVVFFLLSFLFPGYINHYHIFTSVFVFELLFNTILTPFVFKLLSNFDSFIVIDRGLNI